MERTIIYEYFETTVPCRLYFIYFLCSDICLFTINHNFWNSTKCLFFKAYTFVINMCVYFSFGLSKYPDTYSLWNIWV